MPVLPSSVYSNYYLVTVNFSGSTYSVIAKDFQVKYDDGAQNTPFVQGQAGNLVKNIKTPYYTYTIEAPTLITNGASNSFYTSNSLTYIGLTLANDQIYTLNTGGVFNQDYALQEFSIKISESEVMQRLVIVSSSAITMTATRSIPSDIANFISRMARNYDVYVNPLFDNISLFTNNNIYIDSCSFAIKFDVEPKYFLNPSTPPEVDFLIKGYDVEQNYGIVGTDSNLGVVNFNPGAFVALSHGLTLYLGPTYVLYSYTLPLVVKSRNDVLSAGSLVRTDIELSMYGYVGSTALPVFGSNFV